MMRPEPECAIRGAHSLGQNPVPRAETRKALLKTEPRTLPAYRLTVGTMAASLATMAKIMDKAERHADQNGIDLATFLEARLYPDMFNLHQQIQYVCFIAVDLARHFASQPAPHVGYDEQTWADLRRSLDAAANYLGTVSAEQVEQGRDRTVPLFFDDRRGMTALDYAARVSLPDFYFHMSVAYAILRHKGVPLGKADFLGELSAVAIGDSRADSN